MEDFAKGIASSAKQQGQDAVNAFNPTATQRNYLGDYNAMTAGQFGQAQDYTKRFADTIGQNPTAMQYQQQGNEMYGVQPLAQQANYLNTQVTNAYPNAVKQMRGFDAGQGQVDAAVNQNLRFLQPQATAATGQAQVAQNLANSYADRGMQQTDVNLRPITAEQAFIQQQQQGQQNAYQTANTQEMQGLIAKMQSGVELTKAEYDRLNTLYQAEASTRNAQTAANAAIQTAKIGQTYQTLNPNQTVYNTQSGAAYSPVGVKTLAQQFANTLR